MIEFIVEWLTIQLLELSEFLKANFDPVRDTADIAVVALALYWMLLLIRGTRAVQIVIGIMALVAIRLLAEFMGLSTLSWIFDTFLAYAPLMIVVLFQADIRRALARVGRGFFPRLAQQQTSQAIEETVQATRTLAEQGAGALIVLEDQIGGQLRGEPTVAVERRLVSARRDLRGDQYAVGRRRGHLRSARS